MDINEEANISPEQYNQFLPKQRFNIPKSTIQKVKSCITSLNTGLITKTFNQSASTPFSFVINPNNQSVIDLSQCYFNVSGRMKVNNDNLKNINTLDIKFGNLFLSSLFQQASLSMGGSVIALNSNPGVDANLQAMLKFDAYDLVNKSLSDRQFMLNKLNQHFKPSNLDFTFTTGDWRTVLALTANEAGKNATIYLTNNFDNGTHALPQYARMTLVYHNATGAQITFAGGNVPACQDISIQFDDQGLATAVITNHGQPTAAINASTAISADTALTGCMTYGVDDGYHEDYNSVIPQMNTMDMGDVGQEALKNYQYIPFRCKFYLSDLFNYTVDSLDYVFNREINITLQRSSTSFLIANVLTPNGTYQTAMNVEEINKFELVCFSYLLTDTARKQLIQYYSKPVETLYGIQTTNLTPLYNTDQAQAEQNITLPLTVNYDTKCIILAFPKCSNSLMPLSTPKSFKIQKQIDGATTTANPNATIQTSWFGSNSNSYQFGGLNYIRISNTSNSNIYYYDFNGTAIKATNVNTFDKSFDTNNASNDNLSNILDYREPYEQYKQLRLLFGKDPDNAIAYADYLKDYCIIPIDLTGSNIPPNTRIFVQFQFGNWQPGVNDAQGNSKYNPFHLGNVNGNVATSTNLLAIFLGSDVLEYRPDGTCIVKHILTAGTNEKMVNLK